MGVERLEPQIAASSRASQMAYMMLLRTVPGIGEILSLVILII